MADSSRLRVVLDTNVLISACWSPGGLEARTVQLALDGMYTPCVSVAVLAEYREVFLRDKFAALRPQAERLLADLETLAEAVETCGTEQAASDPDDNRFLQCAAAAGADYLVTGNLKHYPPGLGATRVVNARHFLAEGFPTSH